MDQPRKFVMVTAVFGITRVIALLVFGEETRAEELLLGIYPEFAVSKVDVRDARVRRWGVLRACPPGRQCRLPAESFDFLGYMFGRMYSPRTGGAHLGARPRARRCSGSANLLATSPHF